MITYFLQILLFIIPLTLAQEQPWIASPLGEEWLATHERFVNISRVGGDNITVLFIGDSITRRWQDDGLSGGLDIYTEHYVPLGAANYGIGGDSTQHVLWRVINGEVDNIRPRVCILKIGTNNIPNGFNDMDIARGITAIVSELRARLSTTKILLLGVLPRNDAATTEITESINRNVSSLDNGNSIRFLNMVDHYYKGNGSFYEELYLTDLLHLSHEGYVKWHEVMWPLFNEMYTSTSQTIVVNIYLTILFSLLLTAIN